MQGAGMAVQAVAFPALFRTEDEFRPVAECFRRGEGAFFFARCRRGGSVLGFRAFVALRLLCRGIGGLFRGGRASLTFLSSAHAGLFPGEEFFRQKGGGDGFFSGRALSGRGSALPAAAVGGIFPAVRDVPGSLRGRSFSGRSARLLHE